MGMTPNEKVQGSGRQAPRTRTCQVPQLENQRRFKEPAPTTATGQRPHLCPTHPDLGTRSAFREIWEAWTGAGSRLRMGSDAWVVGAATDWQKMGIASTHAGQSSFPGLGRAVHAESDQVWKPAQSVRVGIGVGTTLAPSQACDPLERKLPTSRSPRRLN